MIQSRRLLPLSLVVLTLAACTPAVPHWYKTDVPLDDTTRDWDECRAFAKSFADPPPRSPAAALGGLTMTDPFAVQDHEKAAQRFRQIVSDCMTAKGYRPTPNP